MANRLDEHFSNVEDAAALLASVVTCFTCPVAACTLDSCGGACEDRITEWLEGESDD